MLDFSREFILITSGFGTAVGAPPGIATQEFPSYDACRAAQVQLEPMAGRVETICIAKYLMKE